jgi:hypothetical protein
MALRGLGLFGISLFVAGCAVRVFSPPTGSYPIESAAPLKDGAQSVSGEAFGGGAIFGPEVFSFRSNYRRGVSERLELSASPSMIWIAGGRPGDSHPGIYALRVGAKLRLFHFVSLTGGLGGGASAAGGFVSPDVGLVTAWENRFVVPFASVRGIFSQPLNARRVHFTLDDDAADGGEDTDVEPDTHRLKPRSTFGTQLAVGVKLPLTYERDARVVPSVSCAFGLTTLDDTAGRRQTYGGPSCAVEVVF